MAGTSQHQLAHFLRERELNERSTLARHPERRRPAYLKADKNILSNGLLPGTSSSDTRNFWRESFRLLGKLFSFLLGVVIVYSERVRGEPLVTIYIGCTVDMTLNHPLERGTVVEI